MPKSSISCVHVVPSLACITGGTAVSVPALCQALAEVGTDVRLCTADDEWIAGRSVDPPASVPVARYSLGSNWAAHHIYRGQLRSVLTRIACSSMIVHSHGIWTAESYFSANVAATTARPHVVSCRGMLEPWAMQFRRLKKRIALFAYQRKVLSQAALIHATSEAEVTSIRSLGLTNPIAMVPNGVDLQVESRWSCKAALQERWPQLTGKRIVLFHSRLHRKKGVDELLEVWSSIAERHPDWVLVLSGHDEEAYVKRHRLSASLDHRRLVYLGHLERSIGHQLLGAASLMVLPSYSENFGNVVAEAFAHGVPVITTDNTPWQGINLQNAGACIPMNAAALFQAMDTICGLDEPELMAMGQSGRRWMERDYSWSTAAAQIQASYRWILGEQPMPSCIRLASSNARLQRDRIPA